MTPFGLDGHFEKGMDKEVGIIQAMQNPMGARTGVFRFSMSGRYYYRNDDSVYQEVQITKHGLRRVVGSSVELYILKQKMEWYRLWVLGFCETLEELRSITPDHHGAIRYVKKTRAWYGYRNDYWVPLLVFGGKLCLGNSNNPHPSMGGSEILKEFFLDFDNSFLEELRKI